MRSFELFAEMSYWNTDVLHSLQISSIHQLLIGRLSKLEREILAFLRHSNMHSSKISTFWTFLGVIPQKSGVLHTKVCFVSLLPVSSGCSLKWSVGVLWIWVWVPKPSEIRPQVALMCCCAVETQPCNQHLYVVFEFQPLALELSQRNEKGVYQH